MPNKCISPGCKSRENNTAERKHSFFHFPSDKNLMKAWQLAVPRKNCKISKNSVLCEEHFIESDFLDDFEDSNKWRKHDKSKLRMRRRLKKTAIPTQWPNCPAQLSKNIARSMIEDVSECDACVQFLSPGKMSFTPLFSEDEKPCENEILAREEFLKLISRGALLKPSDVLFVICCHIWMLYSKFMETDYNKKVLMSVSMPRKAFIEVFIQKLEMSANTKELMETKCASNHFLNVRQATQIMFNLFGKNYIADENSKIHKSRKRFLLNAKPSPSGRKLKK